MAMLPPDRGLSAGETTRKRLIYTNRVPISRVMRARLSLKFTRKLTGDAVIPVLHE